MLTQARRHCITFPVDDVTPATTLLEECKLHEALRKTLDSPIESCSDYHSCVVRHIEYQPLLAAVYTAFSEHRPLILSPDSVWITITQGIAHHMAIHAERLRQRFVTHEGKLNLVVDMSGWIKGSPENSWPQVFLGWSELIRNHVGPTVHDTLLADFSTTGPTERTVSQIVMMDIFQRYFHYVAYCICGIPTITLEGTPADWERLRDKVRALRIFDIDWWLDHLLPICDQFVRASRGDVDLPHWQAICKLREEYGGDIINGWVAKLFPYLRAYTDGPCTQINPIFETGEGFSTLDAPSGLSRAPFTYIDGPKNQVYLMEAIGGLVGMTQDPQTLALRPQVGWAVRDADQLDQLFQILDRDHVTRDGAILTLKRDPRGFDLESDYPSDLSLFYHHTNGAELFVNSDHPICFMREPEIVPLPWGEEERQWLANASTGRWWHIIGSLPDGALLAINLDPNRPRPDGPYDPNFAPICICKEQTLNRPGKNPVIAQSFTELLQRLLSSPNQPYWLQRDFRSHGDAEQFTRRK